MENKVKVLQDYIDKEDFIDFVTNWNGKLNCKFFTTIRILNPVKYSPGLQKTIRLKGDKIKRVKILSCAPKFIVELTENECMLDTGYNKRETTHLIREMYKGKIPMIETTKFCLVMMETIEVFRKPEQLGFEFNT